MNHTYEICLALGVVVPLVSFFILAVWGAAIGKPRASYIALAAIGTCALLAIYVLLGWLNAGDEMRRSLADGAFRYHWAMLGTSTPITVGVKLDSLTVIMYFMVTFIAFWIHFFSIGYMEGHSDVVDGESKYHRFFAYLSLFCFSMLGLVVSSSLLFMFFFWELVGLCSYLLIGFYFDKKFASNAGMKAFIVNRVGDFGFVIGLALVILFMGTFDLDGAAKEFSSQAHGDSGIFAASINLFGWQFSGANVATLMGICLFCGAMGKSAQFPLHVWLPDAMAGPTPVSALIHAATMVAAGVYLVARVFRLLTPDAQMFVAVIGCITLTITALIAMVQTDIKKVLAYSTLSQLGYMIFGMGVGAWVAALFHLMTHAFFKAMLFLGSGQVIEGCHHEQDIRKMGGLRKKMPVTCWTFFVGVLAISGFGIAGTHIGLGGFFSKDEILAVAYERTYNWPPSHDTPARDEPHGDAHAGSLAATPFRLVSDDQGETARAEARGSSDHATGSPEKLSIAATVGALPKWMFWLPIIIAYVTPFYMMRCWWLTFWGKPRDQHVYDHAHETWKMYLPLVILAVGTVFCSYFVFRPLLADAARAASDSSMIVAIDGEASSVDEAGGGAMLTLTHAPAEKSPHHALATIVGLAWFIGGIFAWLIYRNGIQLAEKIRRNVMPLRLAHKALQEKLYFDHVYDNLVVMGIRLIGVIAYAFDKIIVDGLVNLTAIFGRFVGSFAGRQLDMPIRKHDFGLVDALVNGIAGVCYDIGSQIRRVQSGRIRTYVMITAGTAAVVLLMVLFSDQVDSGLDTIRRSLFVADR